MKRFLLKIFKPLVRFNAFISYSTVNKEEVKKVKDILESAGASVFIAHETITPGKDFKTTILNNIKTCDLFVPIITEHSIKSTYAQQEIGSAVTMKKKIFPIVAKDIELSSNTLGMLSDKNVIKLDDPKLETKLQWKVLKFVYIVALAVTAILGYLILSILFVIFSVL